MRWYSMRLLGALASSAAYPFSRWRGRWLEHAATLVLGLSTFSTRYLSLRKMASTIETYGNFRGLWPQKLRTSILWQCERRIELEITNLSPPSPLRIWLLRGGLT